MNTNLKLIRAQQLKNDEFYTPFETVRIIFEQYLKNYDFSDKIIYCPCDSEKSNFVIYLKEKHNCLKYKELIYTSDDFNKHRDLFQKANLIITNPPFSLLGKQFLPLLKEVKKDFFIFGSKCSISLYYNKYNDINFYMPDYNKKEEYKFMLPDGNTKLVSIVYISNIKDLCFTRPLKALNKSALISNVYEIGTGHRVYDSITKIPYTSEVILAPITVFYQHYRYMFDIIDSKVESHKEFRGYSDGKNRFTRIAVRIKSEYL